MIRYSYSTAIGYSVWLGDQWLMDTRDVAHVRTAMLTCPSAGRSVKPITKAGCNDGILDLLGNWGSAISLGQ